MKRQRAFLSLLVIASALLSACREPESLSTLRFDGGRTTLRVELADSADERSRGLMGRTELPADRGIVFLFDAPTESWFWMKDTQIPLSIAFWDRELRIVAILDMEPCEENEACPKYRPSTSYVGAVEANQGFFTEHGVEPGDQVELERTTSE
jgi:uncharacterized protein